MAPYHIKETYKDEITVSESTLRRMIDRNTLDAKNVDLRGKVKRKPRKQKEIQPLSTTNIGHFGMELSSEKTVLPKDFFIALGIAEIPPDEIVLRPSLLHKRKENISLGDALSADFEDAAKI